MGGRDTFVRVMKKGAPKDEVYLRWDLARDKTLAPEGWACKTEEYIDIEMRLDARYPRGMFSRSRKYKCFGPNISVTEFVSFYIAHII